MQPIHQLENEHSIPLIHLTPRELTGLPPGILDIMLSRLGNAALQTLDDQIKGMQSQGECEERGPSEREELLRQSTTSRSAATRITFTFTFTFTSCPNWKFRCGIHLLPSFTWRIHFWTTDKLYTTTSASPDHVLVRIARFPGRVPLVKRDGSLDGALVLHGLQTLSPLL